MNGVKSKVRPDDRYRWRERFRRTAFTVLAGEYAGRVAVDSVVQQVKNAAQRFAPGKRVRCRVTESGDVVVRVEPRVRLTPPKEARRARRAA